MRQKTSHEENLFARNMAWLAESHPPLFRRLDETTIGRFDKPIRERGRIVNLETGGTRLYAPNARLQATQEVEKYFAEKRFFIAHKKNIDVKSSSSKACAREDWILTRGMKAAFLKDARQHEVVRGTPTKERSLLVVFGLGLGYHITPLLQRLKPCNVCILETRRENMLFAARSQDFSRWSRSCAQRKGRVFLLVEEEVEDLEQALTRVLAEDLHFFADNFYFYRHATMGAPLKRLEPRMADILESALRNRGFFEDQIRMLDNSTRNLSTSLSSVFLKPKLRIKQTKEALILANGPSLDDALPYLKRLCVGRVVFSCGSTLYTLLKNGIEPHYHCEIENIFPQAHHVAKAQEAGYGLENMTLLAAVTVQPNVVALFPKRVLFMRPLVPFSYLIDCEPLRDALPTVANTALSCAHAMGFSTFYLLGVDCGYKQGRRHHAKDAVHFLDEKMKKDEDARQQNSRLVFRGNFGGYVRSQEVLLATKQLLELTASAHALHRFYNCSDGAFLKGFVPMLPNLIEPLEATDDTPHDADIWQEVCPRLSLADPDIQQRLQRARNQLDPCARRLESMFAELQEVESIVDLQALHNALSHFFAQNDSVADEEPAERKSRALVLSFYIGSVFIFFNHVYECFLDVSPKRWRRLRRELSEHVQKRLRSMKPRLERALACAHDTVSVALREQDDGRISENKSQKSVQTEGLVAKNQAKNQA